MATTEIDMTKISADKETMLARRGRADLAGGTSTTGIATGMTGSMQNMLSAAASSVMDQNMIPVVNPQRFSGMKLDPRSMGGQTFQDIKEDVASQPRGNDPDEGGRGPGEGSSPSPEYSGDAGDMATDPGTSGYSRGSGDDSDITAANTAQTNASDWQKMMGSEFMGDMVPYIGLAKGGITGAASASITGDWTDMISALGRGVFDMNPISLARRGYNVVETAYQGEQVTDAMTDVYGPNFDPNKATPEQLAQMKTGLNTNKGMLGDLFNSVFGDNMSTQDNISQNIQEELGTSEDFVDPSGDPSSQPTGYSGPTVADNTAAQSAADTAEAEAAAAELEADTQKLGDLKSQYDNMSSKSKEQQGSTLERQIKDLETKLGMSTGNAATSTATAGGKDYSGETTFGASGSTDFNQTGSNYDPDRTDNYGGASGGGGYSQSG